MNTTHYSIILSYKERSMLVSFPKGTPQYKRFIELYFTEETLIQLLLKHSEYKKGIIYRFQLAEKALNGKEL